MQYSDVKAQFMGLLNRRDITPSLVDTFMGFAVQRIQRILRIPAMEKLVSVSTDGTPTIPVPQDFLEIISINTNDPVNSDKLVRTDLQTILQQAQIPGTPKFYFRQGLNFSIGPFPPQGTTVWLNYYCDAANLSVDTDHNWLTDIAPALLIYGALSYSCDYFLDDRKQMFEQSFQETASELQLQGQQDELENASIRPAFDTSPTYIGPIYGY